MLNLIKIIVGFVCGFTIMLAQAEKADRTKPLHITANEMEMDQQAMQGVFSGQVKIEQGTMYLYADKVKIREDQDGYQYVEGEGRPVKFREKRDNSQAYVFAQALRFNYNEKTGILSLYEKAWVKQGEDQVMSDIIVYDLNQQHYHAKTQKDQRVNVIFTSKKKEK